MNIQQILANLNKKTQNLVGTEIIAPSGDVVLVSIDGLRYFLLTINQPREWGINLWQITSDHRANYVRQADESETENFLSRLPTVECVYLEDRVHIASHDKEFEELLYPFVNPLGIRLDKFDLCKCAIAGNIFVILGKERKLPQVTRYLRESLLNNVTPEQLKIKHLTPMMRAAYFSCTVLLEEELKKQHQIMLEEARQKAVSHQAKTQERLVNALKRVNAVLINYRMEDNELVVTYRIPAVGTRAFTSWIREDLTVITPGVCLASTTNQEFTLTSLVAAMREGFKHGRGHWSREWLGDR